MCSRQTAFHIQKQESNFFETEDDKNDVTLGVL